MKKRISLFFFWEADYYQASRPGSRPPGLDIGLQGWIQASKARILAPGLDLCIMGSILASSASSPRSRLPETPGRRVLQACYIPLTGGPLSSGSRRRGQTLVSQTPTASFCLCAGGVCSCAIPPPTNQIQHGRPKKRPQKRSHAKETRGDQTIPAKGGTLIA